MTLHLNRNHTGSVKHRVNNYFNSPVGATSQPGESTTSSKSAKTLRIIYTIICLKSVCRSTFADCRSQFLLDRLGRCLKLIVSYRGTSSHEFASQFGLEFFYTRKKLPNHSRPDHWPSAPPTVRTAQQFERHFISSRQVATYVTIHTNGYGWFCWRPKTTPV